MTTNVVKHIVITGKIGAGKSTYAKKLEKQLKKLGNSVTNLDYDKLGHEILGEDQDIRKKIANDVFNNPEKLEKLEKKLHPKIYNLAKTMIQNDLIEEKVSSQEKSLIAIHQIPIYWKTKDLFKETFQKYPDKIFVVSANVETITKRLKESRNMTNEQITARLKSQQTESIPKDTINPEIIIQINTDSNCNQEDYYQNKMSNLNNQFYNENASSFSDTRIKPWEGWIKGMEIISPLLFDTNLPITNPKILDLASGNGRFEKYLSNKFSNIKFDITMADNCLPLAKNFNSTKSENIKFKPVDIISNWETESKNIQNNFDLVCSFGFMHHIPSFERRLKFIKDLTEKTTNLLFLSFWGFANSENGKIKAQKTTTNYILNSGFIDLETEDYILGWKNKLNTFRYCHNFSKDEISEIINLLQKNGEIISCFQADGKSKDMNTYIIWQKINKK
ncbi:MAG: dephospho-CoA kinase [Candidatus Ancillula sp.]|jgi:dephospho-CoA kinase/SAM-dependent methyltransferase|nr:dephospho-CoA kinase [Candidatus Ancillula sp.]